jgi:hypothetical protein
MRKEVESIQEEKAMEDLSTQEVLQSSKASLLSSTFSKEAICI